MEKPPLPPLFGWDMLLESHQRLREAGKDLQALKALAAKYGWQHRHDFGARLLGRQETIVVTDLEQRIVFATHNITGMNGYLPDEVIGRSPSLFQGPETDPELRQRFREAVASRRSFEGMLVNYRKDGSLYPCRIEAHPLFNKSKNAVHFIAFESLVEVA